MKIWMFDLDDTIFDFQKAEEFAFYETMDIAGLKSDKKHLDLYCEINSQMWKMLELNQITKEELKVRRFSDFLKASSQSYDANQLKDIYQDRLSQQGCLIDGAFDFLEDIMKKKNLYAATNGITEIQTGRIRKSGLDAYFKKVYISESMNCKKPEKIFFEKIADDLNVELEDLLLVGDSLTADIAGGRNAGIITIWFNPHHKENHTDIQPTHEVDSYDQLRQVLKQYE